MCVERVRRTLGYSERRYYLDRHNADPKPFVWTKSAETILAKENRATETLDQICFGASDRVRTLGDHAYPHKSGMMLCDVFVMQEEQHG